MQPVRKLHVGIAPHLAKNGGALERLVSDVVQLAEKGLAVDFCHILLRGCAGYLINFFLNPIKHQFVGGIRTRSSASRVNGLVFSHVVHPSRPALPKHVCGTSPAFSTSWMSQKKCSPQ